jgi:hypothetical protein
MRLRLAHVNAAGGAGRGKASGGGITFETAAGPGRAE